jgi:hypothetical protein
MRRIILIATSCPSNNEAAVTILTLFFGIYAIGNTKVIEKANVC